MGSFCRQQELFLGQIMEGVERGNAGEWKGGFLPMLQAVLGEVDLWSQGCMVSSYPAAPLPCLITWRAKQSAWQCGKAQHLLQPPGPLTSCKACPVCPNLSLVQAVCVRGFGCESEIPARAESPAHCFWSILTDRLGFRLSAKDLNMWLFPFLLLALLWLNPSHSLHHLLASRRQRPQFSNLCDGIPVCCYRVVRLTNP